MNLRKSFDSTFALPEGYESRQIRVLPKPIVPPKGLKQKIEGILAECRQQKTLFMFCVDVCGGHTVMGAILHHLIEVGGWGTNREGWIWKSEADLTAEIGVSGHMLRKFRDAVCFDISSKSRRGEQIIDISYHKAYGVPHWHYRVHVSRLAKKISRYVGQKFEPVYAVLLGEVASISEWGLQNFKVESEKSANSLTEEQSEAKAETKPEEQSGLKTENGIASLVCLSEQNLKALGKAGINLKSAVKAWTTTYQLRIEQITDDVVSAALETGATGGKLIGVIANKAIEEKSSAKKEEKREYALRDSFCRCGVFTWSGSLCAECQAEAQQDDESIIIETEQAIDGSWCWSVYDADYTPIKSGAGCVSREHAQIRAENFMSEGVAL